MYLKFIHSLLPTFSFQPYIYSNLIKKTCHTHTHMQEPGKLEKEIISPEDLYYLENREELFQSVYSSHLI